MRGARSPRCSIQRDTRRRSTPIAAGFFGSALEGRYQALQHRMEDLGIIQRRVAVLDPAKLGLDLIAFINVELSDCSQEQHDNFKTTIAAKPEVLEFYRMSDDNAYIICVIVANIETYDHLYKR